METIKVVEVIGTSTENWEDAAKNAVETSARTVKNITGVEVIGQTADVEDGSVTNYKAVVKLAFVYDESMKQR